mgnify:CR=1 FL=1
MKKATVLTVCLTAAIVIAIYATGFPQGHVKTVSVSSAKSMSSYSTANTLSSQESGNSSAVTAESEEVYVVRAYNGHIGVFRGAETKPFRVSTTDISLLPEIDQEDLKRGKSVHTLAEVEKILEDYDS